MRPLRKGGRQVIPRSPSSATSTVVVPLRWRSPGLDQEGVIVIPKAARPESQKANLDALGTQLDDEDRAAIAALPKDQRFVRPPFAPEWDALG